MVNLLVYLDYRAEEGLSGRASFQKWKPRSASADKAEVWQMRIGKNTQRYVIGLGVISC